MELKKLTMEQLEVIAKTYMSVASKSEKGRELLRRFAAVDFVNGVSILDQLPPNLADEFTKTLNVVYEELIKGQKEESDN